MTKTKCKKCGSLNMTDMILNPLAPNEQKNRTLIHQLSCPDCGVISQYTE